VPAKVQTLFLFNILTWPRYPIKLTFLSANVQGNFITLHSISLVLKYFGCTNIRLTFWKLFFMSVCGKNGNWI
jgi:hypothetical protein